MFISWTQINCAVCSALTWIFMRPTSRVCDERTLTAKENDILGEMGEFEWNSAGERVSISRENRAEKSHSVPHSEKANTSVAWMHSPNRKILSAHYTPKRSKKSSENLESGPPNAATAKSCRALATIISSSTVRWPYGKRFSDSKACTHPFMPSMISSTWYRTSRLPSKCAIMWFALKVSARASRHAHLIEIGCIIFIGRADDCV